MNGHCMEDRWGGGGGGAGALDMKIYSMETETPLDLAVKTEAGVATSVIVETLDKVRLHHSSGLHQLAAVAELRQQQQETDTAEDMEAEPGAGDTPRALSATPTCHAPGPGLLAAPSPDSAIHSTIYSPSASPCASRHGPLSPYSASPYPSSSHAASPSLSRNNSDVSGYSVSPSQSPGTASRYHHHPGFPSPAFPSSPLPRGGHPGAVNIFHIFHVIFPLTDPLTPRRPELSPCDPASTRGPAPGRRPGGRGGAGGRPGRHLAPAADQLAVPRVHRQDLRLPLRHIFLRVLQGILQENCPEQEELRLSPRRAVSRHHRHQEEVPRLPVSAEQEKHKKYFL